MGGGDAPFFAFLILPGAKALVIIIDYETGNSGNCGDGDGEYGNIKIGLCFYNYS